MRTVSLCLVGPLLAVAMTACGSTSATAVYRAPDHSFKLTYPSSWQVKVSREPGSPASDIGFYDSGNTELMSVRVEPNPHRLSPYDFLLLDMLRTDTLATAEANMASMHLRPIVVDHTRGSYHVASAAGHSIEWILVPAHGHMYNLFGFERSGISQLNRELKSFKIL